MSITTRNDLINALSSKNFVATYNKTTISSQSAGTYMSLWKAGGTPAAGANPTAVAACQNSTTGSLSIPQRSSPFVTYIAESKILNGNVATTLEFHDRLAAMGSLSGTVATAQNVNLDLSLLGANISVRKGAADYTDVSWWLEWYTATGSTAIVGVLVNVTYSDDTSGDLNGFSLAGTRPASFLLNLNQYIPLAKAGLGIKKVNNITLGTSTGSAGNFGVTATRFITAIANSYPFFEIRDDWASLGFPKIEENACLQGIVFTTSTSSGAINCHLNVVHK